MIAHRRAALSLIVALAGFPTYGMAACTLPAGSQAPVLTLDVVDADRARNPPLIALFADGRMAVRAPSPQQGTRAARLSAEDMRDLLAYVVEAEVFPSIESDAIQAALAAPGRTSGGIRIDAVADAPNSFLTLALPGCAHSVTVSGSAFRASARPDIDALQRFRRIELRLLNLAVAVQTR
ncbi:hypothetical protein N9W17_05890 [Jannaschia sp.]|nr:hypothetical protein [Jannaschia sp.]